MAKIIEIFENATLVSVEQLADAPSYEWDWRCKFTGYNGTIYIGESQHKNPSKRFIMLTDNKNFRLKKGCVFYENRFSKATNSCAKTAALFKFR